MIPTDAWLACPIPRCVLMHQVTVSGRRNVTAVGGGSRCGTRLEKHPGLHRASLPPALLRLTNGFSAVGWVHGPMTQATLCSVGGPGSTEEHSSSCWKANGHGGLVTSGEDVTVQQAAASSLSHWRSLCTTKPHHLV